MHSNRLIGQIATPNRPAFPMGCPRWGPAREIGQAVGFLVLVAPGQQPILVLPQHVFVWGPIEVLKEIN